MILSAQTIRNLSKSHAPMIYPFCERGVVRGRSYGLSSSGYDVRVDLGHLGPEIVMGRTAGPLAVGKFCLAATMDRFIMPYNVAARVHDKSTWIRQGLQLGNTFIEAGWRGYLTLEFIYHGQSDLLIRQGDPIAQIVFEYIDEPTEHPYVGKYQDQEAGPQEARFE